MISLETSRGLYKLVSSSFSKDCDFLVKIISYFDFVKNAIKTKVVKKNKCNLYVPNKFSISPLKSFNIKNIEIIDLGYELIC